MAGASGATVHDGVLAGVIDSELNVVDVPLAGPGSWTLLTSAPTVQRLECAQQTAPITSTVVVGISQTCQLVISATTTGTSVQWQLTPAS